MLGVDDIIRIVLFNLNFLLKQKLNGSIYEENTTGWYDSKENL